jgi:phenylalanyl-tRNA synthetase beta chain
MICDAEEGICIAGVLEACIQVLLIKQRTFFGKCLVQPIDIRKTSFRHGLRTDAATRFEKTLIYQIRLRC